MSWLVGVTTNWIWQWLCYAVLPQVLRERKLDLIYNKSAPSNQPLQVSSRSTEQVDNECGIATTCNCTLHYQRFMCSCRYMPRPLLHRGSCTENTGNPHVDMMYRVRKLFVFHTVYSTVHIHSWPNSLLLEVNKLFWQYTNTPFVACFASNSKFLYQCFSFPDEAGLVWSIYGV